MCVGMCLDMCGDMCLDMWVLEGGCDLLDKELIECELVGPLVLSSFTMTKCYQYIEVAINILCSSQHNSSLCSSISVVWLQYSCMMALGMLVDDKLVNFRAWWGLFLKRTMTKMLRLESLIFNIYHD